jgi:hypothetical protein
MTRYESSHWLFKYFLYVIKSKRLLYTGILLLIFIKYKLLCTYMNSRKNSETSNGNLAP